LDCVKHNRVSRERRFDALAGSRESRAAIRTRVHTLTGLLDSLLSEDRKIS
jgi:hypothetical protein